MCKSDNGIHAALPRVGDCHVGDVYGRIGVEETHLVGQFGVSQPALRRVPKARGSRLHVAELRFGMGIICVAGRDCCVELMQLLLWNILAVMSVAARAGRESGEQQKYSRQKRERLCQVHGRKRLQGGSRAAPAGSPPKVENPNAKLAQKSGTAKSASLL